MKIIFKAKFILLNVLIIHALVGSSAYAKKSEADKLLAVEDPHPQAYFCQGFPVDQNKKFDQYERQLKEAKRANDACRKKFRTNWRAERDQSLKKLERLGLYDRNHWHSNDDWRSRNKLSDEDIRKAKRYAEYVADKKYCPYFLRPLKDPLADQIDTITLVNDIFKSKRASMEFADNLGNEIFNWLVMRSSGLTGQLELDAKGKLIGDEFKGEMGTFGTLGLFFSDGRSKPQRVLYYLRDYIETGSLKDRQFKLKKVNLLLEVFHQLLTKDSNGLAEFASLKTQNPAQVQKYRTLTRQMFRAFLGEHDENVAVKNLTSSTHATASEAIKDFLDIKLKDLKIDREQDRQSILGAVSYILGETDQNTSPPIENREFEFFQGSSMFGKHLKGDIMQCLDCALNMSAMVMCYQRAYATLQDPLVKWTLRKFEFNTPAPTTSGQENQRQIEFSGTTRIDASLGNIGDRFEDYLKTGDFFGAFLQPSTYRPDAGPTQSATLNLLNDTKSVFENAYSNPPTDYFVPEQFRDPKGRLKTDKFAQDPDAMNWIGFQNGWYEKRRQRIEQLTKETKQEYALFGTTLRPAISFEQALSNRIEQDPILDKLKLHYAMESTLRFMTKQSIDTLLMRLNLTPEKIAKMKEPLKSKAEQTRKLILDKKLDIFARTIPSLVSQRLNEILNDPEMKDLPLFEYAIENLRKKSIEDGFDIINDLMNDVSIQAVVQGVSEYKFDEITQNFDINPKDEIGRGLHAIIVGTKQRPSLSNEIFKEIQLFFRDVQQTASNRGISITDEEMTVVFDEKLVELNDRLLNYTFTGSNKKLFKDLVYNLYQKYMRKFLSIDPNWMNNPDLLAIKDKIDQFVKEKADDIINNLKLRSHGKSPLQVIESIEENLVAVLNQDVFGNGEAKELLKALTHELMAVNIEKYASFVLPAEGARKLEQRIAKRAPNESKMDAAFTALLDIFLEKYGSNDANVAQVILNLKDHVDVTFDSFFEEGNQRSIGELVTDLQDKITRDFGQFIITNEALLKETIQNQKALWEGKIARYTVKEDAGLRSAITDFQDYVDRKFTGDASLKLFSDQIKEVLAQDDIKIKELIQVGSDFANERFWKDPESREHLDQLVDELIAAERRRVVALLSKTYDNFDPAKKKRLLAKFEELFSYQKLEMGKMLDRIYEQAKRGAYVELYQDSLATAIKSMNRNIMQESNFRHLLEEVLKDSVTNSIREVNTSTIIPISTKRELSRLSQLLVQDLDTIFDREVEKEFETIGDVIDFVDDIAHYSINEVIVTQSKAKDIGSLFASTIFDSRGLTDFKGRSHRPTPPPIEFNGEKFSIPHPKNFTRSASVMLANLRLKQLPYREEEMLLMSPEELEGEKLGEYIMRLQDQNFSIISPMLGEVAEVIRFQSFCSQFKPRPQECIVDLKAEYGAGLYNQRFLQAVEFLRMAAASEQEGCKTNVSKLLSKENLMQLAQASSAINKDRKDYWNINLWLSEVIKSHKGVSPSVVECALTNTMEDVQLAIKQNGAEIEKYGGARVHQVIADLLTPGMLIKLREQNPDIYTSAYERISDFFLDPNSMNGEANITDVISDHVNNIILPKVLKTPDFQKKALLLLSNANLNTPVGGEAWHADLTLTAAAWFSSAENSWFNALQNDISANITVPEMNEIFKYLPDCASNIAESALTPLKLNAQAFLKQIISPESHTGNVPSRGKNFCFKTTDGKTFCIPVAEEQLEDLDEAQTLEMLIRQTTEMIEKINSDYTTYKKVPIRNRRREIIGHNCVAERNLYDVMPINFFGLFEINRDSFTSREKDMIQRYLKTLKAYMQDMLRLKFLMRSLKEVLPELRKGQNRVAAVKLRETFLKKSRKAQWVSMNTIGAPGYYGPGGYTRPAGEFREHLDEQNIEELAEQFEALAKCLEEK